MPLDALAQLAVFVVLLTALAVPLSRVLQRLLDRAPPAGREQDWRAYARSMVLFSLACTLVAYVLLRLQHDALPADTAINTAVSFVTNTSWQYYAGESSLTVFSQIAVIAGQSFLSAGVGLAVGLAVIRGFVRRDGGTAVGSFYHDLGYGLALFVVPICVLATIVLAALGTPQTLAAHGPGATATWEPIKTLGSVGGGWFNVNSAAPWENPTAASNLIQALLIVLGPAALLLCFGRAVGNRRQGYMLYAVSLVLFVAGAAAIQAAEQRPTASQRAAGLTGGPNLEGKEQRFGAPSTGLYAAATTAGSSGAVDGAMESLNPASAGVALGFMLTGETVFGGLGSGLTGILLLALLSVFLAGLMVGRTPEFVGKKIGVREIKLVTLATIVAPACALLCTLLAVTTRYGAASRYAGDASQSFTEHLWAYVSQTMNNGSAFAGYGGYAVTFADVLGSVAMLVGRYVPLLLALAVAGALAPQRVAPTHRGTLRTDTATFALVLTAVLGVVVLLNGLPALALGPLAGAL